MRWPGMAGFPAAAPGTMKPGQPQRHLTEQRRNRALPLILHMANRPAASAVRTSCGVANSLRCNDFLLQAGQQTLRFGQGQPQGGDLTQIIRSVDGHDVNGVVFAISTGLYQPHNPRHASTSDQRTGAKIPSKALDPQTCDSPKGFDVSH